MDFNEIKEVVQGALLLLAGGFGKVLIDAILKRREFLTSAERAFREELRAEIQRLKAEIEERDAECRAEITRLAEELVRRQQDILALEKTVAREQQERRRDSEKLAVAHKELADMRRDFWVSYTQNREQSSSSIEPPLAMARGSRLVNSLVTDKKTNRRGTVIGESLDQGAHSLHVRWDDGHFSVVLFADVILEP